jgi:hypothetical protein
LSNGASHCTTSAIIIFSGATRCTSGAIISSAAPSITPQEASTLAVVPSIEPLTPLLREATQPNESSSAAEAPLGESVEPENLDDDEMAEEI